MATNVMSATITEMREPELRCLVCDDYVNTADVINGRNLYRCPNCELHFFDSEDLPHDLYSRAYEGKVRDAGMEEYLFRARYLSPLSTDVLLSPALRLSLRWLARNVPPGSTVLDVGCGRGIMLRELRAHGFEAVGTDLAPQVADLLEPQGFKVHVGPVDKYPATLPNPDFVTCNYVLHHPSDPVGFLRSIAERFPDAPLLLTEAIYPNWMFGLAPTPRPEFPRQLTSWSFRSVSEAMQRAGYGRHRLYGTKPRPDDVQLPLMPWIARFVSKKSDRKVSTTGVVRQVAASTRGMELAIRTVRLAKRLAFGGPALYARGRGLQPAGVLAVAIPDCKPGKQGDPHP
ncbi:MAG: class I SAM-dependent methyltransferase [Chloroflexota bacterium]